MSPYQEFLSGPVWKAVRRLALDHYGWRCVLCGSKAGLEVHHRRYVPWGAESLQDLTVLCGEHHRLLHAGIVAQDQQLALSA